MPKTKRAVGIIRVSKVAEGAASPAVQRERIRSRCEADGWELVDVFEELDVSGGGSLSKRPGLSAALALIESGAADVVIASYFDRLFRSLTTQAEVVDRVEGAGGKVFAVDMGEVSNATAGQWLTGTLVGAISEYYRRQTGEKLREAAVRAATRGIYSGRLPVGYLKDVDGRLTPDPVLGPVVTEVFERRAAGASLADLCVHLREHGVSRQPSAMSGMLKGRVYLGEVRYGEIVTPNAHPALVSPDVFRKAQRAFVAPGRPPAVDRLLTRAQLLRCSGCGRPMVLASSNGMGASPRYRCASSGQRSLCPGPVTIRADVADSAVSNAVRERIAGYVGRVDPSTDGEGKRRALETAQEALDGALAVFQASGLSAEPMAVQRLTALREARDAAQADVDQQESAAVLTLDADADWDALTLGERRQLAQAIVDSVTVLPNVTRREADQSGRLQIEFRK